MDAIVKPEVTITAVKILKDGTRVPIELKDVKAEVKQNGNSRIRR